MIYTLLVDGNIIGQLRVKDRLPNYIIKILIDDYCAKQFIDPERRGG